MAANDELPRGVTLDNNSSGSTATITLPACPGIAWVVTGINALMGEASPPANASVYIVVNGVNIGAIYVESGVTGSFSDTNTRTFPPNTAVTITFNGLPAGWTQFMTVTAYPI